MPPLTMRGVVTKVGAMQKTATVSVSRFAMIKPQMKRLELSKKYLTHDPHNLLKLEDKVEIRHVAPVSARKRFSLSSIIASEELKRECIRSDTSYDDAIFALNQRRKELDGEKLAADMARKRAKEEKKNAKIRADQVKRAKEKAYIKERRERKAILKAGGVYPVPTKNDKEWTADRTAGAS